MHNNLADPVHLPEKHFSEKHFPEKHLAEWTFSRMYISLNVHLPECTFGRMDIYPKTIFQNGHLPKRTFDVSKYYTR